MMIGANDKTKGENLNGGASQVRILDARTKAFSLSANRLESPGSECEMITAIFRIACLSLPGM